MPESVDHDTSTTRSPLRITRTNLRPKPRTGLSRQNRELPARHKSNRRKNPFQHFNAPRDTEGNAHQPLEDDVDQSLGLESDLDSAAEGPQSQPQNHVLPPPHGNSTSMPRSKTKQKASLIADDTDRVQTSDSKSGAELTHVNSGGEARMVDVGAKESTRRIAVAYSRIKFMNGKPFHLISENANKKGDVLGVARIAGIMAAKRTADLIPLCHPIPISKVDLDVILQPPGSHPLSYLGRTPYGAVEIHATVECVGPTGVEMEALTAVSGAALTVFDMCKAVDREQSIDLTKVVYKAGGRSGVHWDTRWIGMGGGREFLKEKGIDIPKAPWKGGESCKGIGQTPV